MRVGMRASNHRTERVLVRLPKLLIDEVDRVVREYPPAANNRQQFIENAIRHNLYTHYLPLLRLRKQAKALNAHEL